MRHLSILKNFKRDDGCQRACPLACPPACPPACPAPLLQSPRGAQYAASSTIIIIIRFLFSFWVNCVLLRFAHLWYSLFFVQVGADFGSVLSSFGSSFGWFGAVWGTCPPQKLSRNTAFHLLSVTKAAVDPSDSSRDQVR